MIERNIVNGFKRILALICTTAIALSILPMSAAASETEYANDSKIIVSLGDSYASGEGNPPFGDKKTIEEKVKDEDWLAHRSQNSWSSMLTLPSVSGTMADHIGENWFFAAASGATTEHITGEFPKPYSRLNGLKRIEDTPKLPPQLDVFDKLNGKLADYVTLSIGGNDAGFSTIISDKVVLSSSYLAPNNLSNELIETWKRFYAPDGIRDNLRQAYKDISKKAGKQATIIVTGYPTLLAEFGQGLPVSIAEAILVNDAVRNFNKEIERLVSSCRILGMDIHFVSIEDAFAGHEAFSLIPYIHGLVLPSQSEDLKPAPYSAYSIHPNTWGVRAYAACVQAKIDELEGVRTAEYSRNLSVSTFDTNGILCDNYSIKITGKEYVALWGFIKKDYTDEISVDRKEPVQLNLPEGEFVFTITDGQSVYRQTVITSDECTNNVLQIYTDFNATETVYGKYDFADVEDSAVTYNGHWYKVISDSSITNWNAAQQYCKSQNGYLATITSKEENDFLYDYISKSGFTEAYFGYSDEVSEGVWKWSNGEVSAYSNWNSGEPNSENSNEDYAQFYFSDGTWNDGDFDDFVFICEWGEYSVAEPNDEPIRTTSDERDIVLVLDVSGSMSGTPMAETKKASVNFIDTILDEDASIGIVTYDNYASMLSDFSVNETALTTAVSSIYDGGGTNIESGLAQARSMLNTSNAKKKIIVLMSDGEPNDGKEGDDLIAYADDIKDDGIIIYTLGFFESLGSYKSSAQILMEGIASDGCHYEVASADDLVFFFEDVADQINGQKYIYIRIACPVDVTVTHKGETLCSAEDDLNVRTDFGTLTFEDNENVTNANKDDRIKVLRLKEGADYDVQITGTGHGLMDYTIGFMDENGDYSDFRRFEDVKITRRTTIDTVAAVSKTSVLNIDENGDGKYDLKLRAEENGYGEEVDDSIMVYAAIGSGAFLFLVIVILIARNKRKKRKAKENQ